MKFTNDEMNLMCIYDTGTRAGLIEALTEMRGQLDVEEVELLAMTDAVVSKLKSMSNEAYDELELFPDFDTEE